MIRQFRKLLKKVRYIIPHSFWTRSLILVITPVVLVQCISSYVFFRRHWESIITAHSTFTANDIATALLFFTQRDTTPPSKELRGAALQKLGLEARRVSPYFSLPQKIYPFQSRFERALRKKIGQNFSLSMTPKVTCVLLNTPQGYVLFTLATKRIFPRTSILWVWWTFGSALLFCGLAIFFMRRQLFPIKKLTTLADTIERGDPPPPIRLRGPREIRQITRTLLRTYVTLRKQHEENLSMLTGISHDLRTPLTRIRLQLALMPPSKETQDIQDDIMQMTVMIDSYLSIIEKRTTLPSKRIILKPFIESFFEKRHNKTHQYKLTLAPHLEITVIPSLLERCLQNLTDNAEKYGRYTIMCHTSANEKDIFIRIEDDGPGVPRKDLSVITQPFKRLERGRPLTHGGSGLGLSIVKKLTHEMGGTVSFRRSSLGGLSVCLKLPRYGPPQK
jgi:two-component system osmolarity sensor histidine kinase EnvZ